MVIRVVIAASMLGVLVGVGSIHIADVFAWHGIMRHRVLRAVRIIRTMRMMMGMDDAAVTVHVGMVVVPRREAHAARGRRIPSPPAR
jgi:ABC-type enterochelin transport system permease subunit